MCGLLLELLRTTPGRWASCWCPWAADDFLSIEGISLSGVIFRSPVAFTFVDEIDALDRSGRSVGLDGGNTGETTWRGLLGFFGSEDSCDESILSRNSPLNSERLMVGFSGFL
ncbi:hypothetical protein OGAPHI_004203 [Ogataea philodendri]|uniref:Uncharacterized protein n=1 Tax=Ogataea philodendri TaxID=1378263 RepID=A0A9P8P7D2_9ASCO|nr:uncharacterized protein OGAPHI_004203 [Ogataea philodendri]KAH3666014.1 hypothetical protein OGAPHI_004203 [Ogataea philodendri]